MEQYSPAPFGATSATERAFVVHLAMARKWKSLIDTKAQFRIEGDAEYSLRQFCNDESAKLGGAMSAQEIRQYLFYWIDPPPLDTSGDFPGFPERTCDSFDGGKTPRWEDRHSNFIRDAQETPWGVRLAARYPDEALDGERVELALYERAPGGRVRVRAFWMPTALFPLNERVAFIGNAFGGAPFTLAEALLALSMLLTIPKEQRCESTQALLEPIDDAISRNRLFCEPININPPPLWPSSPGPVSAAVESVAVASAAAPPASLLDSAAVGKSTPRQNGSAPPGNPQAPASSRQKGMGPVSTAGHAHAGETPSPSRSTTRVIPLTPPARRPRCRGERTRTRA